MGKAASSGSTGAGGGRRAAAGSSRHAEAPSPSAEGSGRAEAPASQLPKEYAFIEYDGAPEGDLELVQGWEVKQSMKGPYSEEHDIPAAKSQVALAIDLLNSQHPTPSEDQLAIVRRGKSYEVWTRKDFPKNSLVIVPYSTEIKDRYWTYGRAVSVVSKQAKAKTLALDGRLHHKPPQSDSDKSFSLFWLLPRTTTKAQSNLTLELAQVHIKTKISLPCKRTYEAACVDDDVKVPVLTNPVRIPEHTQLVALEDTKLMKKIEETKKEQKKK